jgi:EmrB/QacA subfamily drug resistance transporter
MCDGALNEILNGAFRSVQPHKGVLAMSSKARWIAFSAALAATLMDLLDSTIAGVAGPSVRADLGGSYASLQWIAAAYTLAMSVGLLTGGRLGDVFGRKRVLLAAAAGFTAASLACALAPSMAVLIAARVAQGAIGAAMVPQVFGMIRELFAPDEMGRAWGILGPVCGLAAVLGPVVAGLLIDADPLGTGWRSVFLVNLPVGAFVLLAGGRFLPDVAPVEGPRRLDAGGTALAAAGTFMVVYPLVQGRELGWPAWVLAMLAGSVPVLIAFALHQVRRTRAGASSLVETSVFGHRSFVSGVVFALVFVSVMAGLGITLGILMQVGLGWTPLHAALASGPFALGGFAGSAAGGMVMHRLGRKVLQAGLLFMGAGLAGLYATLEIAGAAVAGWDFAAPLAVAGIGLGMVFVPMFDIVMGDVADHEVGSASGLLQSLQSLGMSLGVAVIGTIYFGLLGGRAGRAADFVAAAEVTTVVTGALAALAFALAFALPARARAPFPAPEPVLA